MRKKSFLIAGAVSVVVMLILVALVATTALTMDFSRNKDTVSTKAARLTPFVANATADPGVTLTCPNPIFTIALNIDRGLALDHSRNMNGKTQVEIIKSSTQQFLANLYDKIVVPHGGKVNVLLNAMAVTSVSYNRLDASNNKIIEMNSDPLTLTALQQDVQDMYFMDWPGQVTPANPYGIQNPSSLSQRKYGYNPSGVINNNYQGAVDHEDPADQANFLAKANFDDALLEVAKAGSTTFNNPAPGQHIDMSLMLASGVWDIQNHADRVFSFRNDRIVDWSPQRFAYAKDSIDALRKGTSVPSTSYGARPPMSVRGIFFNSAASVKNELEGMFGATSDVIGYAYAENGFNYAPSNTYEAELNQELDDVVNSISFDPGCPVVPPPSTTPTIEVSLFNADGTPQVGPLTIDEGSSHDLFVHVKNTSSVRLFNITLTINSLPVAFTLQLDPGEEATPTLKQIVIPFGTGTTNFNFTAEGFTSSMLGTLRADDTIDLPVNVNPNKFPS